MGKRREKLPLGKSGHSFHKASSWRVPGKRQQWRQQEVRSFLLSLLPESFLQGPQVLQGLLSLRQLLLKPLTGAFIGGSLQEGLHFLHHCPVARRVVEEPHCSVPTGGQKPASDVKGQVTDTLPVDLLEALLLLTPPGVVEMNTAATGQGQDLGIRGERQAAWHGARFFKVSCPQQVGVLLLLVFHVCVPQLPRAVLGDRGHPPGVIGESEEVHGCRVALQFKGSHNLLEVPFLPKADFPNFYIWGEATRGYKPATRGYSSISIVHVVGVDGGQHLAFQIPNEDGCVTGSSHDELPCVSDANVDNGCLVLFRKVLWGGHERIAPIVSFYHLEDTEGVSISEPDDECSAVRAEAHQDGMVQVHVGSHAAVLPLQEVLCAPDADGTVVCTGSQVFAIAAEVHASYVPTVALGQGQQQV